MLAQQASAFPSPWLGRAGERAGGRRRAPFVLVACVAPPALARSRALQWGCGRRVCGRQIKRNGRRMRLEGRHPQRRRAASRLLPATERAAVTLLRSLFAFSRLRTVCSSTRLEAAGRSRSLRTYLCVSQSPSRFGLGAAVG
jgi:hypothetical protein